MNYRYFLSILFLLSAFFILPNAAKAFMASTPCAGPYLGVNLIPPNSFPDQQFYCPGSQSSYTDPYVYSCQESPVGTRTCFLTTNVSQSYNCVGNIEPTSLGNFFTGCVFAGDTTPPSPPQNLTAVSIANLGVQLSWDASTDNSGIISNYYIYRCVGAGCTSFVWLAQTLGVVGYTDPYSDGTGLLPLTTYRYRIVALDGVGNQSNPSSPVVVTTLANDSTPPSTPTNLSAIPALFPVGSSQINLSWTASTDNIGVAGYRVYRNGVIIASNVTATTYSDTGLAPSTAYTYTVEAYDAIPNYSGQSAPASATTLAALDITAPAQIINLTASGPTSNSMALSWTAPGDDGNTGTAAVYDLRYSTAVITSVNWTSATQAVGEPAPTTAGTFQNMTVSGLNPSTLYYFAIVARDEVGNQSVLSANASASTLVIPDTTPPVFTFTSPVALLPVGTTSATLGGFADELALCRYSDTAGQNFNSMLAMNPTVLGINFTATISGLSNGGLYTYYVKCQDAANNVSGDFTIAFAVDSPAPDTTPPVISNGAPAGPLPANTTSVTMSARTNEPAYCAYSRNTDMSYSAMTAAGNAMTPDAALTYHSVFLSGLSNGASYLYYIRCQDTPGGNENTSGYIISFSVAMPPNVLPVANMTAGPVSGDAPLAVTADGSASYDTDGAIAQYVWRWGDGTPDTAGSAASHTYTTVGTYTLALTVVDNQGGVGTASQTITVNSSVPPPPPPTTGICAPQCIDDSVCAAYGLNMVCAPNGICTLKTGFCTPGTLTCSNNSVCPASGVCPAPVFLNGYFTLPGSSTIFSSPANFSAGTTALIMSVDTDVAATCQYSTTPNTQYGNTTFMRDFTNSASTTSSVALSIPRTQYITQASQTYNYYIRCKDTQTGDVNTVDYALSFTIGAPTLIAPPAPYICWINQNFIKNGIPYFFDVCKPGV